MGTGRRACPGGALSSAGVSDPSPAFVEEGGKSVLRYESVFPVAFEGSGPAYAFFLLFPRFSSGGGRFAASVRYRRPCVSCMGALLLLALIRALAFLCFLRKLVLFPALVPVAFVRILRKGGDRFSSIGKRPLQQGCWAFRDAGVSLPSFLPVTEGYPQRQGVPEDASSARPCKGNCRRH